MTMNDTHSKTVSLMNFIITDTLRVGMCALRKLCINSLEDRYRPFNTPVATLLVNTNIPSRKIPSARTCVSAANDRYRPEATPHGVSTTTGSMLLNKSNP